MIAIAIFLILLWIRPEYMFLLFYVIANTVLFALFTIWSVTPDQALDYAILIAINDLILIALGALVVALRKWMKSRRTGSDKKLDGEMERIRAEIAARDSQPPTAQ